MSDPHALRLGSDAVDRLQQVRRSGLGVRGGEGLLDVGEFVGLVAATPVVPCASHGVEPVRFAPAGQSGVAEFGEEAVVTEEEGDVARHALGLVDGGLCRSEDLERYAKVRFSTVGRLRALGFALLPTLATPHFDVLLPDLKAPTLDRLEMGFDSPVPNPARRR